MKRCPTCQRVFSDQNLSFCTEDGTPLAWVEDDEATSVAPPGGVQSSFGKNEADWNAVGYKTPMASVPPGKRKVWPWVLGVVGILALGGIGLAIAAALLIPRINANRQRESPVTTEPRQIDNGNLAHNSNSSNSNSSNSNGSESVNTPPPAENDLVLAQLTALENEWTAANINADKKKLDLILADDYAGGTAEGRIQGKSEYLRTIQPDPSIEKWNFEDLQLTLHGERATLTGKCRLLVQGKDIVLEFDDRFVWRDGRWQATGSQVRRSE